MKAQHTPGPWKVAGSCHVKESADGLFYHVAHIALVDANDASPIVAEVLHRGRFCSYVDAHTAGPEQAANARLIAAAPDMAVALRRVAAYLSVHDSDYWEGNADAEKIRAALALASA